jgi:LPXTG-motif cell wall-anchored protein
MRLKAVVTATAVAGLLAGAPASALARTTGAGDLSGVWCGHADCSTIAKGPGDVKADLDKLDAATAQAEKVKADVERTAAKIESAIGAARTDRDTDTHEDRDNGPAEARVKAKVEAKVETKATADVEADVDAAEGADVDADVAHRAEVGTRTTAASMTASGTPTGGATTTTAAADTADTTPAAVAGFESAPAGANTGAGASSSAVLGVETLPSTSTTPAPLAILGLALVALGGLLARRRDSS